MAGRHGRPPRGRPGPAGGAQPLKRGAVDRGHLRGRRSDDRAEALPGCLASDVSVGIERTLNSVDTDVVAQVVLTWLDDTLEGWPEGSDRHARVT
jgi:hypothetical protein